MLTLRVCNKWDIQVDDDALLVAKDDNMLPYFQHFSERRLTELAMYTWCMYSTITKIADLGIGIESVVDYFGGSGRLSIIVENVLHPASHTIVDLQDMQYKHLLKTFPYKTVIKADSYEIAGSMYGDLSLWDGDRFTLHNLRNNRNGLYDSIYRLLQVHPKCAAFTDITASRFPLLKKYYTSEFYRMDAHTILDYFHIMSDYAYTEFGYSIVYVAKYRKLSMILMVPGHVSEFEVANAEDCQDSYTYLRWI